MPATSDQQDVAKAFLEARANRMPLADYPGAIPQTMADAYAIQDAAIALDGRRVGGWKVGRIGPVLADRFGSNRLTGPIFSDEIVDWKADTVPEMPVYANGFAAAEAEILLRVGTVEDRDYDILTVGECIDEVRTGIEIASSPFADINRNGPAVTASDYGNNRGLVVGPAITGWQNIDLIRMPVELAINGHVVGSGTMDTMLDGPLGSLLFLIGSLRDRGIVLEPGTWVSAGAITGVHEVQAGQTVQAVFDGQIRVGCTIKNG